MNTDNMALSGETIDYGPCAFMDTYDPATVFSSIDHGGRYAYGNQPPIAQWNLARLAEAMLPLFDPDVDRAVERATAALDRFPDLFEQHWLDGMRAKLGLFTQEDDDKALVDDLLAWMQRRSADFTNTFRSLTSGRLAGRLARTPIPNARPGIAGWRRAAGGSRSRPPRPKTLMRRHNPAFIPRNHNVEEALLAATSSDDFSVMERLLEVLATPYDHERDLPMFSAPGSGERALPHVLRHVAAPHPSWSGSALPSRAESMGPACYAFALFRGHQTIATSSTPTSGSGASNSSLARQE